MDGISVCGEVGIGKGGGFSYDLEGEPKKGSSISLNAEGSVGIEVGKLSAEAGGFAEYDLTPGM